MKKIYLILIAVLGMTATSCLMEEKELFDKTPAERMEAYLEDYRTILSSAEEGWLLQYFPEENQAYGGYTYILQFSKDSVTAYFELADKIAEPVSSLYKMTPDDGPVITFDTYNENIHFFATPDVQNYEAYHGDYEFRIVGKNADATEIYMKGKRTNNNFTLVKFSGDPVEYLGKVKEVSAAMVAPKYEIAINDTKHSCSIKGNVFEFSYTVGEGEEAETISGAAAFCYTPEGVSFYAPVEINGVEYAEFIFNKEAESLAAEDGKVIINKVYPPLNEQFVTGNWFIKYSTLGPVGQQSFDLIRLYENAIGEELQYAFIGNMLYPNYYGFQFLSSGYGGSLNFTYTLEGEDVITIKFAGTAAGDGAWYYQNAGFSNAIKPFVNKTFQLTTDNLKAPSYVTLTEVDNEVHTMTLFAAQIAYPLDN